MTCKHAQELLSDYIDGDVAAALSVSFENHIAECADCRHDLSGIRTVWEQLHQIPAIDTPMYFHENIMRRIDKQIMESEVKADVRSKSFDWRSLFRPRSLAYAAGVLVIVLGGSGVMNTTRAGFGLWPWNNRASIVDIELKKSSSAQIMFDTKGGANLIVHMQAATLPNNKSVELHYSLNIKGSTTILLQGSVTSESEIMLPVHLYDVSDKTFTLEANLSYKDPEGHETKHKQTVPVISVPFNSNSGNTNPVTP